MTEAPRIYCTDLRTGEYLPEIEAFADRDPLDPDNWLIPAGAYLDQPPMPAGNQAVLRGASGWYLVEDHRGSYYRTSDGAAEHYGDLGPRPAHLTAMPRPTGAHVWRDGAWVFDEGQHAKQRVAQCQSLCATIDFAADNARAAVAGDPLRAVEYDRARIEAQAFADAGYPGDAVPRTVAAWAINGRTAQQAADSILAEAAAYTEALYVIRETRLAAKEQIRSLMAAGEDEQAQQLAEQTIAAIEVAVTGVGNAGGG